MSPLLCRTVEASASGAGVRLFAAPLIADALLLVQRTRALDVETVIAGLGGIRWHESLQLRGLAAGRAPGSVRASGKSSLGSGDVFHENAHLTGWGSVEAVGALDIPIADRDALARVP